MATKLGCSGGKAEAEAAPAFCALAKTRPARRVSRAAATASRAISGAREGLGCESDICMEKSSGWLYPVTGASRLSCGVKARRRLGRAELFDGFAEVFNRGAG